MRGSQEEKQGGAALRRFSCVVERGLCAHAVSLAPVLLRCTAVRPGYAHGASCGHGHPHFFNRVALRASCVGRMQPHTGDIAPLLSVAVGEIDRK